MVIMVTSLNSKCANCQLKNLHTARSASNFNFRNIRINNEIVIKFSQIHCMLCKWNAESPLWGNSQCNTNVATFTI